MNLAGHIKRPQQKVGEKTDSDLDFDLIAFEHALNSFYEAEIVYTNCDIPLQNKPHRNSFDHYVKHSIEKKRKPLRVIYAIKR